jgi:putative nucleotidyltransferase with HDIG domain
LIVNRLLDRTGWVYFKVIPVLGICVLGWALLDLFLNPPAPAWLALAALTVLTGWFTVKIPSLVARLSVSEPFVFAATLWFGPSVGAVTAALDALIMSLWLLPNLKTPHRVIFNVSVLVISIWVASQGFFLLAGIDPRAPVYNSLADFILPLYLFTACCFLLNSGLVAIAISFERGQSAFKVWREHFLWLSLNYFGGASVAAVLVVYAKEMDWAVVGIIVPLLAISYLTFRTTLGRLEDANDHLGEVNRLYLSTIETLAMAVDAKDQVTHGHIRRVQRYALGLAQELGLHDEALIKALQAAALLHDMGKVAIPDYILNKPNKLTDLEFEKMKLHAGIGADILSSIAFPYPVVPIVRHHHENWDGSGYPDGLRGTMIPLGARILSVVDCFDALTSDRPYRPRLSVDDALQIVIGRRGSMYDPVVVDAFAANLRRLEEAARDLGPESPTLRQIAELNNPASFPVLQPLRAASPVSSPSMVENAWAAALSGHLSPNDLAPVTLGLAVGTVSANGCAVHVVDKDGASLLTVSVAGLVPRDYLGTKTDFGRRICGWVAANRITSVNSIATLDLDQKAGTRGLMSSLVSPILDADGGVLGVLAFYSNEANAFTIQHQRATELLAGLLSSAVKSPTDDKTQQGGPTGQLQQLISEVENSKTWWPVGVIVTRTVMAEEFKETQDQVWQVLRQSVRADDSLVKIDSQTFLLLLLRSTNITTRDIAARIQHQLSGLNAKAALEWAAVDLAPGAEDQAFTSLADAIHHTAMEADGRTRRTTH